jgi:hypothetical protein
MKPKVECPTKAVQPTRAAGVVFAQLLAVGLVCVVGLLIAAGSFLVLLVLDGGGDTAPSMEGVLLYGVTVMSVAVGAMPVARRAVRALNKKYSRHGWCSPAL